MISAGKIISLAEVSTAFGDFRPPKFQHANNEDTRAIRGEQAKHEPQSNACLPPPSDTRQNRLDPIAHKKSPAWEGGAGRRGVSAQFSWVMMSRSFVSGTKSMPITKVIMAITIGYQRP